MTSPKVAIYSATQKSRKEDTALWKSIQDLKINIDLNFWIKNKTGLPELYNSGLLGAKIENLDYVMFIHDDVHLEHDPRPKLEKLFQEFDIVGVAGCSKAEIKSPALWHIMGQGHTHGAVAHMYENKKYMTSFGVYPQRVVMIDGVFMAFNRKAFETVRFDEDCPSGFHFYDCCYCARAVEKGLKIGVGDVIITHESPGLKEFTEDWKAGESYYIQTYGS